MRLFQSTCYAPATLEVAPVVSTPLGNLERTYGVSKCGTTLAMQPVCYRHLTRDPVIYEWASQQCILEELVLPFYPQGSDMPINSVCCAILFRVFASTQCDDFSAKLHWQPGYRWFTGIGEPGEGLESRVWYSESWEVTVGTESCEYLGGRSRAGKWMPRRMSSYFENNDDAVIVDTDAVTIHLAKLNAGECSQFQFIIASSPRQEDASIMWLCVDQNPESILNAANCV